MTIIVHPVGQGDLGNDIFGLKGDERKEAQKEAEQEFRELLKPEASERLLEKLLKAPAGGSRFNAPPLSLILRALPGRRRAAMLGDGPPPCESEW